MMLQDEPWTSVQSQSFIVTQQNAMLCYANGVSVLIFVVFTLLCYCHALKASHMSSLPLCSAAAFFTEREKRRETCSNELAQHETMSKTTPKPCYSYQHFFFFILHCKVRVREADQCQLNLSIKCRSLRVQLKIAEGLKWRQEGNGATGLESDVFIVSLEAETG